MDLTHTALLATLPDPVAMAELGIAVAIIGMALAILLPQQLLGHAFTFQLLVDGREVRFRKTPLPGDRLCRKQQLASPRFSSS